MLHTEGRFTGERGRSIYHQYWQPHGEALGLLLVVHGAGEHSARYEAFARDCTGRGFAVAALDHNGHGLSEGVPGSLDNFDDYLHDLHQWREILAARFSALPTFLVGHSMGGLIAGRYLPQHQAGLAGCVLCAALVITPDAPGVLLRGLVKLLARLAPRLGVHEIDPANVSRDLEVVREYAADPLNFHGRMGARMLWELFNAMDDLQVHAEEITLPLLLVHGAEDRLTAPAGSELLYARAGSQDKHLTLYPTLFHEIFNEPERQTVIDDVLNWCTARLPAA